MNAARKLEPAPGYDPVLAALDSAPLAEEPETEEERAADMAAIADYRAGRSRQGVFALRHPGRSCTSR